METTWASSLSEFVLHTTTGSPCLLAVHTVFFIWCSLICSGLFSLLLLHYMFSLVVCYAYLCLWYVPVVLFVLMWWSMLFSVLFSLSILYYRFIRCVWYVYLCVCLFIFVWESSTGTLYCVNLARDRFDLKIGVHFSDDNLNIFLQLC